MKRINLKTISMKFLAYYNKVTAIDAHMAKNNLIWDTNDQNRNIYNTLVFVFKKPLKSKESFETPSPDFHLKLQFFFRKRCLLVSEDVQEKSFIFFYFFTFDEVHTPTCFRSQGTSCQNNFRWKSQRMKNKSELSVSFFEITNEIGLQWF